MYRRWATRDRTVTISFRISKAAFEALREDAKRHNTSINTLANQIFTAYAEHDRFLQKLRMVKLSTPTLKRILEADSVDALVDAGRKAGGSVPVTLILSKMGELNPATAIQSLKIMGTYGNLFDYSEIGVPERGSLTLAHDLGERGSAFLGAYVESLFQRAGGSVKVTSLENVVRVEFDLRSGGAPRTSADSLQMNAEDTST